MTNHYESAAASQFRWLQRERSNPARPTTGGFTQSLEKWETQMRSTSPKRKEINDNHNRTGIVTDMHRQSCRSIFN